MMERRAIKILCFSHLGALMEITMSLALLVWVGGGLVKWILYFFDNDPSLGQKSPILHSTHFSRYVSL